jgi:serine/threonine-protein kinase
MNHPGMVSVYDTGSDNGTHYIVMEHVQGRTLAQILNQDGRLLPSRAAEIAEAVAASLSFAHGQGIVHRDIKPANIMITSSGEVKVMDFGIARATAAGDTLTQTATVLGTASYLSPEQAQGEPVDERSDIYSLGVVLFEMLTGQPPFAGDSAVTVAYKHVREEPVPPTRLNPEIPPGMEAVTMKALAKNPDNRYQSADEMRSDLARVRHGQPPLATPILPPEPTQVVSRQARPTTVLPPVAPDDERRRRRWLAGIIIGLIVAGGLVGLFLLLYKSIVGSTPQVVVPSVKGFNEVGARSALRSRGLQVKVTRHSSDTVATGLVISQDPKAGQKVDQGSAVTIVVSSGKPQVRVPDVRGQPQDQATAHLEQHGLTVGSVTQQPSTKSSGTVIDQNPKPHQKVDKGTPVSLVVSSGPPQATVPYVVCLTINEAQAKIQAAHLTMQQVGSALNLNCPDPNKVAQQNPQAGNQVQQGSVVKVYTSEPSPTPSISPSSSPTPPP